MVSSDSFRDLDKKSFGKLLQAVRSSIKENEMKWAWLFILSEKVTDAQKKLVESIKDQFVGVALIDATSKNIVHSDSYIAKQAKRFIKL
jgi:hypothetical protein